MQRGSRGCTRGEVRSERCAPRLGLVGRSDASDVANARGNLAVDRADQAPKKSVVGLDCNAAAKTTEFFEDAARSREMIQSRHSRRSVPISLSQSEFAFGLRTGVLMTSRPIPATEASTPVEKIASRSWSIKRYVWSEGWLHAAVGGSRPRSDGQSR
jgi:hypothetical protein